MGKFCVITGEDDLLVSEAAKKIFAGSEGLEIIDSMLSGNEEQQLADIRRAKESWLTPPFFDPVKTTWWKNVKFLPGGGKKKSDSAGESEGRTSEAVKTALQKFAELTAKGGLPENQNFIISSPHLLATSVLAKTFAKTAEMISFAKPKAGSAMREAEAMADAKARELGLVFSGGALARFVARVGSDTRSLWSELDKMLAYKGGKGEITSEDVDAISSPGAGMEAVIWEVTDAFSVRDTAKCVAAARRFEGENGYAVMMTTVLERRLRELIEAKDAQARGMFGEATKAMAPWAVRKLEAALSRWTLIELRTARLRFMNLREACVSGGGSDDSVMIEIVRTCAKRQMRPAAGGAR